MLISPPFLPARAATQTEDQWLDACMTGGAPGDGAFPVSFNLGWHGGVHLTAPAANPATTGNAFEKVRATADGTVVFVRQPTAQPAGPLPADHPQAYKGGWTDNGCVVIRHETEIGEGADASVRFFSIYMHLRQIESTIVASRAVYRKAVLGIAGQIYAHPGDDAAKIHFEIICDGANLQKIVGRASGDLPLTADGRTDAVFGEVYFHLPVDTQFFGTKPADHLSTATTAAVAARPATASRPATPAVPAVPIAVAFTSTAAQIVGLRYAGGQGAAGNRGDAILRSYQMGANYGVDLGVEIGTAIEENDAEYNLYTSANDISKSYPAAAHPAPSAVYQLLRFGRTLGTEDTLTPATAPHWRKVNYPGGQGWVNLNATGIYKFSDADYPHWKGWRLIDDDPSPDSHCNSPIVRGWIDPTGAGIDQITAVARLSDTAIQDKLKKCIFKFPTEWDSGTIDARWGWLKTQSTENPTPMSATDFEQLRAHITALAFWPGGTLLDSNHWHFEPRQFIKQFKKCGWLKRDEMKQMVPSYAIRNAGSKGILWEQIPLVLAATGAFARQQVPLNKMLRKYGIRGEQRLSSFFGNAIQETAWFVAAPRYRNQIHENNTAERYFPWDGRGFLQLTWSDNYINYWDYLGRSNQISAAVRTALHNAQVKVNTKPRSSAAYATADTVIPQVLKDWRNDVADPDGTDAAGSAGYYWAKLNMASYADAPHQLERVSVNTNAGNHTYYRSPSFWRASAAVNLPAAINTLYSHSLNGFEQRCSVYSVVLAIAGDDVRLFASANGTQLDFPEGMQPRR